MTIITLASLFVVIGYVYAGVSYVRRFVLGKFENADYERANASKQEFLRVVELGYWIIFTSIFIMGIFYALKAIAQSLFDQALSSAVHANSVEIQVSRIAQEDQGLSGAYLTKLPDGQLPFNIFLVNFDEFILDPLLNTMVFLTSIGCFIGVLILTVLFIIRQVWLTSE